MTLDTYNDWILLPNHEKHIEMVAFIEKELNKDEEVNKKKFTDEERAYFLNYNNDKVSSRKLKFAILFFFAIKS